MLLVFKFVRRGMRMPWPARGGGGRPRAAAAAGLAALQIIVVGRRASLPRLGGSSTPTAVPSEPAAGATARPRGRVGRGRRSNNMPAATTTPPQLAMAAERTCRICYESEVAAAGLDRCVMLLFLLHRRCRA